MESGRIPTTSDPTKIKFSEEALEEQSHSVRIADEKVALASQAYDMVFTMASCMLNFYVYR
jgi:inhibitor of growth protein 4